MKKIMLGLSAMCLIAFVSCKENAAKKIEESNVVAAAERDAVASTAWLVESARNFECARRKESGSIANVWQFTRRRLDIRQRDRARGECLDVFKLRHGSRKTRYKEMF